MEEKDGLYTAEQIQASREFIASQPAVEDGCAEEVNTAFDECQDALVAAKTHDDLTAALEGALMEQKVDGELVPQIVEWFTTQLQETKA